jgi:hypothetical protein
MAPPQQETIDVPMPSDEMPQMAAGGLTTLPVPDAMFDEPDNGGYATGGLVAFAGGGALGPWFEEQATSAIPGIGVTSRRRSAAQNAQVGGVPDSYHVTDNARDFVPPKGMSMDALAAQLKSTFGRGYDVINEGDHVHVEPGSKSARTATLPPRDADTSTPAGRAISVEDSLALGSRLTSDFPREEMERARKYALEKLDPETQDKEAKADMWEGLAAMGFRLASSNSPNILQAIGEAATATLPELKLSKKERKAAKDDAIRTLMAIEDVDRKTAIAGVEVGMDIYKSGISADQASRALAFQERELASRIVQAGLDRASAERIASMRTSNPTEFESAMAILASGDPKMIATLEKFYSIKRPQTGSLLFGGEDGGAQGGGDAIDFTGLK